MIEKQREYENKNRALLYWNQCMSVKKKNKREVGREKKRKR